MGPPGATGCDGAIGLARLLIPLLLIPLWWIGLRLTKRLPHHRWWGDVGHRLLLSGW